MDRAGTDNEDFHLGRGNTDRGREEDPAVTQAKLVLQSVRQQSVRTMIAATLADIFGLDMQTATRFLDHYQELLETSPARLLTELAEIVRTPWLVNGAHAAVRPGAWSAAVRMWNRWRGKKSDGASQTSRLAVLQQLLETRLEVKQQLGDRYESDEALNEVMRGLNVIQLNVFREETLRVKRR